MARIVAGILLTSVGLLALLAERHMASERIITAGSCRLPTTIYPSVYEETGQAVVLFHGLAANRRLMTTMAWWTRWDDAAAYLVDLPGHGDNPEPFRFQRAEACAAALLDKLTSEGKIHPEKTVLLGHSMGGRTVIRLADAYPAASTVALSPAPGESPRRMPSNLLILSAQFDPPRLKEVARQLAAAAGGERSEAVDFNQKRAFRLLPVPRATHTSLVFDPFAAEQIYNWMGPAVQGQPFKQRDFPFRRLLAALLGLLGLGLLFGPIVQLTSRMVSLPAPVAPQLSRKGLAARWLLTALLAVLLLNFFVPLRFLRLYDGDYLVSYLFVAGVVLMALLWDGPRRGARSGQVSPIGAGAWQPVVVGALLGLATVLAFGKWLDCQLYDAWLNAPRWGRFAAMLPFLVPYFFAEEGVLGAPIPSFSATAGRYLRFLLLRGILWAALLIPIFVLGGGPILALLLAPYLALFSIFQRMGTDAVHRTSGPAGAAVFAAILAAWLLAAALPIT